MLSSPRELAMEVQLCVEGDGAIDPAALTAAVNTASQACPGARLVRRGRLFVDSGQPPAVSVREAADFDRTRLDSPLLRTPLARNRRGSCEVVLVRGTPTTVIFRAQHAVMDGHGAMFWQRQVFRALRGEPVEGADSRLTEVLEEVAAKLGVDLPPVSTPPGLDGLEWRSPLGPVPSGPLGSMWRRRVIDGTHPAAVARIARIVAAFGEVYGLVDVPVDLRQFLPGLRTTAMVSGKVRLLVRPGDDWNDVQASLLTALREHQYLANRGDEGPMQLTMPRLRALRRQLDAKIRENEDVIRARRTVLPICSVSHLGAVDLGDFCADGFEATSFYSLGSVTFVPAIDVVESGGRTEVTVAWRDGPDVAERAEALLDRIEEDLSPRRYRVWDGNDTARPVSGETLTSLFAGQVARTPDAVAVSGAEGDVTYAELARRARAVAAALQDRGIGRGDRVGLVAGRSAAAITAIWGILQAGAAYLPIDAAYPDARITQILTDAGAAACLLEPPAGPRDCLPPGCPGISLDTLPRPAPGAWREVAGQPGDLACVLYTSGSTGAPKGVEIEHRGLVNCARWVTREAGLAACDRIPLVASISFDMAGYAIFLALAAGGTVLPVREVNAATLREVIEDGGATAMAITPSHLELINQAGIRRSAMRVVMTGGELLRRATALRALEVFGPRCRVLCQWGPTETGVVNTSHEFDPGTDTGAGVPFGRPGDNNTLYLLDSGGRFVPPGEPGEVYVGGVQVARGYLGRPDLTRQRFVRLADGTRVYRTGDIARLLPAGDLAFISRIDDQVKIAGHRVEPAEIAQVLEEHPEVTQAAVIPRSRPGRHDKELCAYVVAGPGVGPAALTEFLAARLPRYMIPAAIIAVPDIPRNANGKTDARQLPDPFTGAPNPVFADGRDDITAAVARIWADTLQVGTGQITDQADFHQLGGNSLMLLSMINEVSRSVVEDGQDEFMSQLHQIISEPTLGRISELARQARTGQRGPHSDSAKVGSPE
jgi:amino acid adenylation domain-containing protein